MPEAAPAGTARSLVPGSVAAFGSLLASVPADGWTQPTPCADWTVSELANHVVGEHLWAPHILAGETIESVGDRYDGDVVGEDPHGSWSRATARSVPAFEGVADDEQPVHLSFGTVPADEYCNQMLLDLVVHGWDLAMALRAAPDLDAQAVATALAYCRARADMIAGSGVFAAPVATDSGSDLDQLVALLGRSPNWTPGGT